MAPCALALVVAVPGQKTPPSAARCCYHIPVAFSLASEITLPCWKRSFKAFKAGTVGEAISELQSRFPGMKERLVDDNGEVRRFVNVYVNEEDIRFLKNQETPLNDGDEVSIIPAIAGG